MAKIEHINDKRGVPVYPVTVERAVIDSEGVTLDVKLANISGGMTVVELLTPSGILTEEQLNLVQSDNCIVKYNGYYYYKNSSGDASCIYNRVSEEKGERSTTDYYFTCTYSSGVFTFGSTVTPQGSPDAVKYVEQELTASQKAQARSNIEAGTYSKPAGGIPASDLASGVIPSVPNISTDISTDASSDAKTASPKAVKTYVDGVASAINEDIEGINEDIEDIGIAIETIGNGAFVIAWDGESTPVAANIPAGVSVTHDSDSYTGSLAASASTVGKIYLVATGTSGNYDRYVTVGDSTYSWVHIGTTSVALEEYATNSKVSQLELEVHNLAGKFYGVFADDSDLPEGDAVGYAFVGTENPYAIWNFDGEEWSDSGSVANGITGKPGVGFSSIFTPDPYDGTVIIVLSNNDTITLDLNHNHPAYYSKVLGGAQPVGGFEPDVVYSLGTLSGTITFSLASPVTGNVNHYFWMFDTGSTAPTVTWPTGITWADGSAPTVAASKHYEVSILGDIAYYSEV